MNTWKLITNQYDEVKHLHEAPVNTIGNGLLCCRGFFEEQQVGIAALGGIYMAGVFGRASYRPWTGVGRELVNVPNFYWAQIFINNKEITVSQACMQEFSTELDMKEGIFTRSYVYVDPETQEAQARFTFRRFISNDDIYVSGQYIQVEALKENIEVKVVCGINTNITNLNEVSCEPHPVQPGKKQYTCSKQDAYQAIVNIEEPDVITLGFAQDVKVENGSTTSTNDAVVCEAKLTQGECMTIRKMVAIACSLYEENSVEEVLEARREALPSYEDALNMHIQAMEKKWEDIDIQIDGNEADQQTVRYNILQLLQSCPEHTNKYSIGARGLTGEMYEGSVFWDTEIFMLPFFTLTRPKAAKKLLEHRYLTLPQAKKHAQSNFFDGAMYGWQVNPNGEEQTPQGVGAYYSIHVIADIAYAILEYWYCTKDYTFILEGGLEILIETARFWASRVQKREDGYYDINAVRGPNEYDVLVNNNLYTNMMARENFYLCKKLIDQLTKTHSEEVQSIKEKLNFKEEEFENWNTIAEKIVLPFEESRNLWLEDDTYLRRKYVDMKKLKPTAKRIIDTTVPYEALPVYQVSKQADVLHVMKNLPWHFAKEQIEEAYAFYEPRTAFDSSLAYSMFALMAARLGRMEKAEHYFSLTANLDIKNVQLNTISGLHFANFGGTWQDVVFGFAGIRITEDAILCDPHIPTSWGKLSFTLYYRETKLQFVIEDEVTVTALSAIKEDIRFVIKEQEITLKANK